MSIETILKKYQDQFARIVPFNPAKDKLLRLDFTADNKELTSELVDDTTKFSGYINQNLLMANARYGIGGYGEQRVVYSRSRLFGPENSDEEPRRLHLGMDIWGKPYTSVTAPLDGIVHSFAFNNNYGDYGATIILSHHLDTVSFHTLYGHLSMNSIKNLQGGERIEAGDIIADFGIAVENGHWPPHLHFQVIMDLQGWKGDYPGVCKVSEKEWWLQNCPDPDLILQLNRFL